MIGALAIKNGDVPATMKTEATTEALCFRVKIPSQCFAANNYEVSLTTSQESSQLWAIITEMA